MVNTCCIGQIACRSGRINRPARCGSAFRTRYRCWTSPASRGLDFGQNVRVWPIQWRHAIRLCASSTMNCIFRWLLASHRRAGVIAHPPGPVSWKQACATEPPAARAAARTAMPRALGFRAASSSPAMERGDHNVQGRPPFRAGTGTTLPVAPDAWAVGGLLGSATRCPRRAEGGLPRCRGTWARRDCRLGLSKAMGTLDRRICRQTCPRARGTHAKRTSSGCAPAPRSKGARYHMQSDVA